MSAHPSVKTQGSEPEPSHFEIGGDLILDVSSPGEQAGFEPSDVQD
jgi:hypothetical protein